MIVHLAKDDYFPQELGGYVGFTSPIRNEAARHLTKPQVPWRSRFVDLLGRATCDLWIVAPEEMARYSQPQFNEWGEDGL